MLQYPTNIYPQNVAFDPTIDDDNNRLKFIFNGDILTTANFKIYDYMTGELVSESHYATSDGTPWKYNGEEVTFARGTLGSGLSAGNDYVIQMMLTQTAPDGLAGIYDMPVVRGKVVSASEEHSATSVFIESGINNIYEWETSNGLNVPTWRNGYIAAGMLIQIGTEKRFIESYDRLTGEVVITSAFDNAPSVGDSYVIFSNYIVTPQYYFMCRKMPTISVNGVYNGSATPADSIHASGTYTQYAFNASKNTLIKYFNFKLYWNHSDLSVDSPYWVLIKSSPKVYSQFVDWYFLNSLVGLNTLNLPNVFNVSDTYYKIECNIVTQDGMSLTGNDVLHIGINDSDVAFEGQSLTATIANEDMPDYIGYQDRRKHQAVYIEFAATTRPDISEYNGTLYRRDLETNEVVYLGSMWSSFTDYLVPNNGSFEYIYVPRETATGKPYTKAIVKTTIQTDMEGYTITALIPIGESYDICRYRIGDCWKFVGEVDDSTVTQNIDRSIHIGANNYSSASMGDVNYASGTLSAMIGAVDCSDKKYKDTINMVKAWREFITKNSVFLLKSQKGDVWVVNITDSPTTSYQEMTRHIPTTFSFSWAECMDSKKVSIVR